MHTPYAALRKAITDASTGLLCLIQPLARRLQYRHFSLFRTRLCCVYATVSFLVSFGGSQLSHIFPGTMELYFLHWLFIGINPRPRPHDGSIYTSTHNPFSLVWTRWNMTDYLAIIHTTLIVKRSRIRVGNKHCIRAVT